MALRLGCVATAGCTAVQPIPPHSNDLRFPSRASATSAQQCADLPAGAGECIEPALPLDGYFGTLAQAIWDVDLERRRFARLAAEKTNQANLFNAMLWPVGAYVGAHNLAHPSASLLRDAGAFSLAIHGLLGSGIADRDRLYLAASQRMACAISLASGHLYAKADIGIPDSQQYASLRTLRPGMPDLAYVQHRLKSARDQFRDEQVGVLADLVTRKTTGPPALSAVDRRRQEASGGAGGTTGASRDVVAAFSQSVSQRLDLADKALKPVNDINGEITLAALQLRDRRDETRRRLDQALILRAPALAEPAVTGGQVLAAIGKFAQSFAASAPAAASAASAATAKSQGGQPAWQLDEKTLAPLTDDSRKRLRDFETRFGVPLRAAQDEAVAWRRAYDKQLSGVVAAASENGCSAALFGTASSFVSTPAASAAGS